MKPYRSRVEEILDEFLEVIDSGVDREEAKKAAEEAIQHEIDNWLLFFKYELH